MQPPITFRATAPWPARGVRNSATGALEAFNRQNLVPFEGFWSAVWHALLDTDPMNEVRWNLPLAISLRGHKRASDNRRGLYGGSGLPLFAPFQRTATRDNAGTISLSISSRFPPRSGAIKLIPVTLPPGRAKLATRPVPKQDRGCAVCLRIIGHGRFEPHQAKAIVLDLANPAVASQAG
jgi:hypothetical protein